jgi:hypothetical protein
MVMNDQDQQHDLASAAEADTAREEVVLTGPSEAPLPDPAGLHFASSPVDLPEPAAPLKRPLLWTFQAIAAAGLFLALFNAGAIRSWSYELAPTALNQRVVEAAEAWYDLTASVGLNQPVDATRAGWKQVQAARFDSSEEGPGASPEPSDPRPGEAQR